MTTSLDEALKKHRAGRLDDAEQDYRAILEADPRSAEAWGAAEPLIEKALEHSPNAAKYHNNYGVAAERLGKTSDALTRFARAAELDPDFADAHCNLGTALQALGRTEDAERSFERALALEPGHARAHSNLATVAGATAHFRAAADNDPKLFEPLRNLCVIYKEAGLVEPARPFFARALAVQDSDGLRINRALLPAIYDSQAHIEETRATFEAAVDAVLQDKLTIADPLREVGLAAFYLPYQGYDDRALQTKLARLYAGACPALNFTAPHAASRNAWQPERRLRVGFASASSRNSCAIIPSGN
jgi:tetratricopeptide (TPR) repeat protein